MRLVTASRWKHHFVVLPQVWKEKVEATRTHSLTVGVVSSQGSPILLPSLWFVFFVRYMCCTCCLKNATCATSKGQTFSLISAELADWPERHVIKNSGDAVNGFSGTVIQQRRVAAGPGHTQGSGPECAIDCRQEQHPVCVCVVTPQVSSAELILMSTFRVSLLCSSSEKRNTPTWMCCKTCCLLFFIFLFSALCVHLWDVQLLVGNCWWCYG